MKRANFTISILLLAVLVLLSLSVGRAKRSSETSRASKSETFNSKTKEGCYVWKDSVGWWNVCWFGSGSKTIGGQIWSPESLVVSSGYDSLMTVRMPDPNLICFKGNFSNSLVGFRFISLARQFDIDVRLDGKRVPDRVFFGGNQVSPGTLPIRVEDSAETAESGRPIAGGMESTAPGQRVEGFPGIEAHGRTDWPTSKPGQSFSETPPGTTSHLVDKRTFSPALRLPDSLRGWPPASPPDPRDRPAWFDLDDSTSTITQVYDVATGKIRRLDEEKTKKPPE